MPTERPKFEVTVSVENLQQSTQDDFAAAANTFLEDLQRIDELDVEVPQRTEQGTRGLIAILSGIAVWGAKIGAFKALYIVARDLLKRYEKAEVVLKFKDGSTLKITGLSEAQAELKIEEHLRKASKEV